MAFKKLDWKIHVPRLLKEILVNKECQILERPIQILANKLGEVAERSAELNDPQLNALMCELSLYSIADPDEKKDYNPDMVEKIRSYAKQIKSQKR